MYPTTRFSLSIAPAPSFGNETFRKPATLVAALFLLLTFSASPPASAQQSITVGGTGTGTLLLEPLIKVYAKTHPSIRIQTVMPPLGSRGGLRALNAGAIQMAVISTTPAGLGKLEEKRDNTLIAWACTPMVFTGRDVSSETNFSLNQIAAFYSGGIQTWPNGRPIRLVTRTEREIDTLILREYSPAMDAAMNLAQKRLGMPFAENDVDNQLLLEKTPASFGTVSLGQLMISDSPLKAARVEGVAPSLENLKNGSYRFEKTLFLAVEKTASPATLEFLRFLQSPEAINTLKRLGFVPKSG